MYQVFDLNEGEILAGDVRLLYVSSARFERDWNGDRHSHECTEISFCIQGRGEFCIRDAVIPAAGDDLIIVPPFVEHSERSTPSAPLEYVVFGVSGVNIAGENLSVGYRKSSFRDQRMQFVNLLTYLLEELENRSENYLEVCSSLLNILLVKISRLPAIDMEQTRDAAPAAAGDNSVFWVKQYIDDNFTKEVNLDLLAGKVGLNKFSLVRRFKSVYGCSPINYLLDRKFQEAKFLLLTTENSVKQIATALGFSSANYFTQAFQQHVGVSPTEYRRQGGELRQKDGNKSIKA